MRKLSKLELYGTLAMSAVLTGMIGYDCAMPQLGWCLAFAAIMVYKIIQIKRNETVEY